VDQTSAGIPPTKLLDYQGFKRKAEQLLNKTEHHRSNPDNHRASPATRSRQAAQPLARWFCGDPATAGDDF
jgi:hypothetical protein